MNEVEGVGIGVGIVAVVLLVIMGVGVAYPITKSVVASANASGTDALILGFLGTLIVVGILVGIVRATGLL